MASQVAVADQNQLLAAATKKVKEHAFYMKRAMDQSELKPALKSAADMLHELRRSDLSPKTYYELYMKVLDELRYLEEFFHGLVTSGTPAAELYERVQGCDKVLPRMYLLITVGGVYITSKQAPAKDILKDLVEMSKGVQNPTRGLFLRHYLSHVSRDKLPGVGSEYALQGGGSVDDAVDFVIQNFSETNWLWVRMQSQGGKEDKKRREKERQDLRILVGTNLVRLSQLEGVDRHVYKESVLPRILEQVVNCKDSIAQSYLLDCLVHVFPDEYHLETLGSFLGCLGQLKEKVQVRLLLEAMMERLAKGYADDTQDGKAASFPSHLDCDLDPFELLEACVDKLISDRFTCWSPSSSMAEVLRLRKSLLAFGLKCYPGQLDKVNACLGKASQTLAARDAAPEDGALDEETLSEVESLLSIPLKSLALDVLSLTDFDAMLAHLPWPSRKQVGLELARAVLASGQALVDEARLEKLLEIMSPLIKDDPNATGGEAAAEASDTSIISLEEEQGVVARLVHLLPGPDTDAHFTRLLLLRRHLGQGGVKRIQYTLAPLVFAALALARRVRAHEVAAKEVAAKEVAAKEVAAKEVAAKAHAAPPLGPLKYSSRKVFQFVHEIVGALGSSGAPELALGLLLQGAMAADACDLKAIAYEFISQASILYEDELTDSKAQHRSIARLAGTLIACRNFNQEDFDTLVTKTAQYAAKLLKKHDQSRMVTLCSHLFWVGKQGGSRQHRDARRVLECLQRAVQIADDMCMAASTHVDLFIEILNHYLYHFESENEAITEKYISGLLGLIHEHLDNMEASARRSEVEAHYRNTLAHIRRMKEAEATREKFASIVIPGEAPRDAA